MLPKKKKVRSRNDRSFCKCDACIQRFPLTGEEMSRQTAESHLGGPVPSEWLLQTSEAEDKQGRTPPLPNLATCDEGMGMSLDEVIKASTWSPAKAIQREELGHLSEGAIADIAILRLLKGKFGFYDKTGYKIKGKEKFECEVTIKGGAIVYDLNGSASPIYVK